MFVRLLLTLAASLIVAGFAPAADPEPKQKPDPTEQLITKLFEVEVDFGEGNVNDVSLFELLQLLSKKYAVTFIIKDDYFKAEMAGVDVKERKPTVAATQLLGLTMHQFLVEVLDSMGATYLIKGGVVEIVPPGYARKVSKVAINEDTGEDSGDPLVSVIVKKKSLADVVEMLAKRYDLNVVIGQQAGETAAESLVSARLLNVTADRVLEMLAVQCDLRVVRNGNAFLITTRERAKELAAEELEKERQKIELEKLRASSPKGTPPIPPKPATKDGS